MQIEQRVRRLERQNRFFKAALLGTLILCVIAGAKKAGGPITAEGFTLMGPGGKKAATLEVTTSGPVLRMYDGHGTTRAALGMVRSGDGYLPAMGFFDQNENPAGYVRLGHSPAHLDDLDFAPRGLGDPRHLK